MTDPALHPLEALLQKRIVIIDGAMGTTLQQFKLSEADFRGERFKDHHKDLKGNGDILSLTKPEVIASIHRRFLEAGADIIETNTFSGQAISQSDYDLEAIVDDINIESARLARHVCDEYTAKHGRPTFVAGAMGPTTRSASISRDANDPGARGVTYVQLVEAYKQQALGLIEGGVDTLLVETIFDTLNAKAALFAIEEAFEQIGRRLPIQISVTIFDSGRTLNAQTLQAFWLSVAHAKPLSVGVNCALGPEQMRPFVEELSNVATCYFSCYPNAGCPIRSRPPASQAARGHGPAHARFRRAGLAQHRGRLFAATRRSTSSASPMPCAVSRLARFRSARPSPPTPDSNRFICARKFRLP